MKKQTKRPAARPGKRGRKENNRAYGLALSIIVLLGAGILYLLFFDRSPGPALTPIEYVNLARAAEDTSYLRAQVWLEEAVEVHPEDSHLRNALGQSIDYGASESGLRRGRLMPLLPTSFERISAAREALQQYDRASRMAPRNPEAYARAGNLYTTWGLTGDALIEIEKAIRLGERGDHYMRLVSEIVQLEKSMGDPEYRAGLIENGALNIAFPESTVVPVRERFRAYENPIYR